MFFREKISPTDAVAHMFMIVTNPSTDPTIPNLEKLLEISQNNLAKEVINTALFGVHFSTELSIFPGWRENGRDMFNLLLDIVIDHLVRNYGVPEVRAREPIEHTFATHSLSCEIHPGDPAAQARALGENLNAFVSTHASEEVVSLGARVFADSFEAVVDLHKTHKLVV